MKQLMIAAIGVVLLASCAKTNQDSNSALLPDMTLGEFVKSETPLSEIFEEYTVIPLETTDESLVGGRFNKVIKKDSTLYVQSINDILMFGLTGQFKGRLSKVGAGPGEYASLSDFDVLPDLDEIWVSSSKKIYRYRISTSDFIGSIPLSFYANKFKYLGNNEFIAMTPDEKVFNICSTDGAVLKSFMDNDVANSGLSTVMFLRIDGCIASPVADTNSAACYDPRTHEFSMREILPENNENIVTMEINRTMYDSYGEMEFSSEVMESYAGIISFRKIGNQSIMSLRYPGIKNAVAICNGAATKEYIVWPDNENVITDDIFGSTDASYMLSFSSCESDDSFMFLVGNQDPDLNPYIVNVTELK